MAAELARPRVPSAVSALSAGPLAAPARGARVLAAFPTAVYLALERHDQVLPLLTREALLLPTGVRLAASSTEVTWGVAPGDVVPVGDGRVELPTASLVGVRTWRPVAVDAPDRHAAPSAWSEPVLDAVRGVLTDAVGDGSLRAHGAGLAAVARTGRDPGPALRGLVGAGQGLTPSGDDAVCGVLLALRALGLRESVPLLRDALPAVLGRTTSLSASLLTVAADGYAVPEVTRLVRATAAGDLRAVRSALPGVLAVGHSSGRDLVAGVLGALDALLDPTLSTPTPTPILVPTPTEGARRG